MVLETSLQNRFDAQASTCQILRRLANFAHYKKSVVVMNFARVRAGACINTRGL
jgi:hypothetical protein